MIIAPGSARRQERASWYSIVVLLLTTRYTTQPSRTTSPIDSGSVTAVAAVCATAHTAPYAAAAGDSGSEEASGSATTWIRDDKRRVSRV